MPSVFAIRRTNLSDLDALVNLRIALLHEVGDITTATSQDELTELIRAHRRYFIHNLPAGNYAGSAAEAEGKIVGNGGLVFLQRPPYRGNLAGLEAYLMNVYTVPEWRGKGVATAIVSDMLALARQSRAKRVWLHAEPEAKRIYERAGFVPKNSEMEILV